MLSKSIKWVVVGGRDGLRRERSWTRYIRRHMLRDNPTSEVRVGRALLVAKAGLNALFER